MPTRHDHLQRILEKKAIAVARMTDAAKLTRVIEAIRQGDVENSRFWCPGTLLI